MRKKAAKRIVDMKKSGRSWTEIADATGFSVMQCKAEVEKAKKEVRKELAAYRQKNEDANKKKPVIDIIGNLFRADYPPYKSGHASQYKGVYYKDFTKSPEEYEREHNAYLDFLLEELGKLG